MKAILKVLAIVGVLLWSASAAFAADTPGYSISLIRPHSGNYKIGSYVDIVWSYSAPQDPILNLQISLLKGRQVLGIILKDGAFTSQDPKSLLMHWKIDEVWLAGYSTKIEPGSDYQIKLDLCNKVGCPDREPPVASAHGSGQFTISGLLEHHKAAVPNVPQVAREGKIDLAIALEKITEKKKVKNEGVVILSFKVRNLGVVTSQGSQVTLSLGPPCNRNFVDSLSAIKGGDWAGAVFELDEFNGYRGCSFKASIPRQSGENVIENNEVRGITPKKLKPQYEVRLFDPYIGVTNRGDVQAPPTQVRVKCLTHCSPYIGVVSHGMRMVRLDRDIDVPSLAPGEVFKMTKSIGCWEMTVDPDDLVDEYWDVAFHTYNPCK